MQVPLAERLRPQHMEGIVGQQHLTAKGSILRNAVETGNIPSIILWGPPGVGKTTMANVIASSVGKKFFTLSAIAAGVKDIRSVIEVAQDIGGAILFIDEIHRFNKGQQDALLAAVEKGTITLIGATTENPSFEVNSALLSRCQVYVLRALEKTDLLQLLQHAITQDEMLKQRHITLQETEALLRLGGGDARKLLNVLEMVINNGKTSEAPIVITDALVMQVAQQRVALYDKTGDAHYDVISAFIKSMRGSDPNAAVYWLARMIEGGEDVKFIARRMLIFASEDIGNANPNALLLATSTFNAVNVIGYPESNIILSQCAIYLASSVKSNASYLAIKKAMAIVKQSGDFAVPLHLRNAPTNMMKQMDFGKDYKYAHDFEQNFTAQEFLPKTLEGTAIYEPQQNSREMEIRKFLKERWKHKYNY